MEIYGNGGRVGSGFSSDVLKGVMPTDVHIRLPECCKDARIAGVKTIKHGTEIVKVEHITVCEQHKAWARLRLEK